MLKVIIVGGVAAGMSAAAKLKRNMGDQVDVIVLEKGREVSYSACGIPLFVGGVVEEASSLVERTADRFRKDGIDVRLGHEATKVDIAGKKVLGRIMETGEEFSLGYDKLIVASGARPRTMPPLDGKWDNLYVVRDVEDGVRLRQAMERDDVKRVAVVGAGYIGLEIVDACVRRGKKVVLMEFADRVLSVLDPEITDQLTLELKAHGVEVRTRSKVLEFEGAGGRIGSMTVENVAGTESLPVDAVVNCAGIIPNAGFINVEKSANGAIVINGRMETSAPDVYAAGDCCVMRSFLTHEPLYAPLGTNANKQGRMLAELLAGKAMRPYKLIGSSAIRLFDVDAAKVGLSELDAQRLNLDYEAHRITGNSYASYYGDEQVMVKLVYDPRSRRILGAQTFGKGVVVPRANYFAIAISAGMTLDEFGYLDLCYAPPFSGVWDVSMIAVNTAKR